MGTPRDPSEVTGSRMSATLQHIVVILGLAETPQDAPPQLAFCRGTRGDGLLSHGLLSPSQVLNSQTIEKEREQETEGHTVASRGISRKDKTGFKGISRRP